MRITTTFCARRRPAFRIVLGVALSVLLAGMLASSARAGIYKMYSCNVPGRSIPMPTAAPWRPLLDNWNSRYFDNCLIGGTFGIGLDLQMMRKGASAGIELRRPEGGPKSMIGIVGYRTWIVAALAGSGSSAFVEVGGAFSRPGGTTPDGMPWVSAQFALTNPAVYVLLFCGGDALEDCHFDSPRPLGVRGIESDLYENQYPSGSLDGGTLLDGSVQTGSRTVRYTATDDESGVAKIEYFMGSAVVAADDLDGDPSICPHTDWGACPARYSGEFSVDTGRLAEGEYVASLRVTDAAGNRRVVKQPGMIRVARRAAAVPPATIVAGAGPSGVILSGQFAANARTSYTTAFARAARVRGRLKEINGRPIGGARLVVTETFDGAKRSIVKHVITRSDGKYVYFASGIRPSRRITIRYKTGAGAISVVRKLRLRVRAASSLRIALRGVTVAYKGTVMSRPIPRGGKRVFLQGRAKGGAWQRFAVRKTDMRGRFAGRYRLRVRRPGVRLQFRVEIPKQTGYPYLARTGTAITKTVR